MSRESERSGGRKSHRRSCGGHLMVTYDCKATSVCVPLVRNESAVKGMRTEHLDLKWIEFVIYSTTTGKMNFL